MLESPASKNLYSEEFRLAVRQFELGFYDAARLQLLSILRHHPQDPLAFFLFKQVQRRLSPRRPSRPRLVWQADPDRLWETEWLRTLFNGILKHEVVDGSYSFSCDALVVVDRKLSSSSTEYYSRLYNLGCKVLLVHLSDEGYEDDNASYRYCNAVLRNNWSPFLAEFRQVRFFPLGFKSGFLRHDWAPKPASQRKFLWSFAGYPGNADRVGMLAAMNDLSPGFRHLTSGFGSVDALPVHEYRGLMDETTFVPCPAGWMNLDTYRVYEALEAGCIPIVPKRPRFDYFTAALGAHPIPTVANWAEGAELVRDLAAAGRIEPRRQECGQWWGEYKQQLIRSIADLIETVCNDPF